MLISDTFLHNPFQYSPQSPDNRDGSINKDSGVQFRRTLSFFFYFIGIIIKDINVATLNKNEKMFGLKVVGWMDGQMKIYD